MFDTPITLTGPPRQPRQMLADQSYGGHASVHDGAIADDLGLAGAPIEGPTHFSQFDPLAFEQWGQAWFESGCISAHFKTMVIEGEDVTASLTATTSASGRIDAVKTDGTPVLTGTASIGADDETELDARLARSNDPGDLFIFDQMRVGQRSSAPVTVSVDLDTPNGELYPFSLRQKLDGITESTPWYASDDNPWGRAILPLEMISVLSQKVGTEFPVRGPSVGLFLDLEIRLIDGPLFVGQNYVLEREVVGLGQSRRTESSWVRTTITDADTGARAAAVLLHSGVFKESYADYPAERL
ncbi:MAG TPA: hypothetical protein VMW08_10825 [Acidimicrobiales bacterium]|nr:hypothetical protein [Acidimicrobiales bacterium]